MLFSCWYGDICTSLKISFHCRSRIRVGRVVNALESDLSTYLCKSCVFLSRPAASCCSSPHCVGLFFCAFSCPWTSLLSTCHDSIKALLLHTTFIDTTVECSFHMSIYFSLLLISNQHTLLCDLVLEQTCITVVYFWSYCTNLERCDLW